MFAYLVRRLLQGIPTIFGVTLATFLLLNVFGGDPVRARLGKSATQEDIRQLRQEYGLDRPLSIQYLDYLRQIATLDFGKSFVTREEVRSLIGRAIGPSLSITAPALLLTTLLALLLALFSAYFRGSLIDRMLVVVAVLGMSISFLVYIVAAQYFLAFRLGAFQIYGYNRSLTGRWEYLVLPILIQVIVATGYDVRFYRTVLVEETTRNHVRTALAKGLSRPRVMVQHVLRNGLIPIITRVMITVPFLVTGSLLIESFFGIPGLGLTILNGLDEADYPVIKAVTVLVSVLFVLGNIATDILYSLVDPRVRLS